VRFEGAIARPDGPFGHGVTGGANPQLDPRTGVADPSGGQSA